MRRNGFFFNPDRRTIAVLSGKGGTGKTSISAAIGYILAHCGFKTLLLDLDFFTKGATFFLCKGYPANVAKSLSQLFTQNCEIAGTRSMVMPSSFSRGNLFLLPSVTESEKAQAHFSLSQEFGEIKEFTARLVAIIEHLKQNEAFDYVLLDTRGGTDYTSVGAAFAAGSFILVSEADKPSWHMGELLLDAIRKTKGTDGLYAEQIGFIINKVDLPSAAIETYLQDRWKAPHLGTIPFNEKSIRFFQQSKSPIVEDPGNRFSREVLTIVGRTFVSESWKQRQLERLSSIYAPGLVRRLVDIMF